MMVPSAAEIASMMRPSAIRPVFDRHTIREASSSCCLRKRLKNDIQSLGVKNSGGNTLADTAFGNITELHDHSITANPIVVRSQDFVFAWKAQVVIRKNETTRWCIVGSESERRSANHNAA